jgi:hypothetical protein
LGNFETPKANKIMAFLNEFQKLVSETDFLPLVPSSVVKMYHLQKIKKLVGAKTSLRLALDHCRLEALQAHMIDQAPLLESFLLGFLDLSAGQKFADLAEARAEMSSLYDYAVSANVGVDDRLLPSFAAVASLFALKNKLNPEASLDEHIIKCKQEKTATCIRVLEAHAEKPAVELAAVEYNTRCVSQLKIETDSRAAEEYFQKLIHQDVIVDELNLQLLSAHLESVGQVQATRRADTGSFVNLAMCAFIRVSEAVIKDSSSP